MRASGVLMHVSMLWGDYSIGSFGDAARGFVDFLCSCGFKYWQVLPMGVTDGYNSPYKSYSAFAGNPYFVDLEILAKKKLLTREELAEAAQITPYVCEYDRLRRDRIDLLLAASKRVTAARRGEIREFCSSDKRIYDFCRYMSEKETCYLPSSVATYEEILFMWEFIQCEFFEQWRAVKAYANERGIKIVGDIPMYVSEESSDVFYDKGLFQVDECGVSKNVAGVPPDDFSRDGQLWGNPLYDWSAMREDGYSWWRERIRSNLELFDALRIDHFRAFESYWSIPSDAASAKEGRWIEGEGERIIDAIREVAGEHLIIAEDLGVITPEVRSLVEYSGFYNTRVLQFAFPRSEGSVHIPHSYIEKCVAYTGTHDNNTLLGYIMEAEEGERRQLMEYLGTDCPDAQYLRQKVIFDMLASSAGLVIIPIQDILGYGADTRMNTPGTAKDNWAIRFTERQIASVDTEYYKRLNTLFER